MFYLVLLYTGSPTTRWASVALGAGVGIGAAYTECSYIFNGSPPKWSPKVSTVPSTHPEVIAFSLALIILSAFCWYFEIYHQCVHNSLIPIFSMVLILFLIKCHHGSTHYGYQFFLFRYKT
jgi:hypothetical protein